MFLTHHYEGYSEHSVPQGTSHPFETVNMRPEEDNSSFDYLSQDSCCDLEFESEMDSCEEAAMPPPRPYYHRHVESSAQAKLGLTRATSDQNLRRAARAKEFLRSPHIQQSLPNLYNSRLEYNRRIGSTEEFRQTKQDLASRIDEFEALLADL